MNEINAKGIQLPLPILPIINKAASTGGDGGISKAELGQIQQAANKSDPVRYRQTQQNILRNYDTNKDGKIAGSELKNFMGDLKKAASIKPSGSSQVMSAPATNGNQAVAQSFVKGFQHRADQRINLPQTKVNQLQQSIKTMENYQRQDAFGVTDQAFSGKVAPLKRAMQTMQNDLNLLKQTRSNPSQITTLMRDPKFSPLMTGLVQEGQTGKGLPPGASGAMAKIYQGHASQELNRADSVFWQTVNAITPSIDIGSFVTGKTLGPASTLLGAADKIINLDRTLNHMSPADAKTARLSYLMG